MRKNKIDRDIVMLLVMTMVTLISWVGFEVYRAYTKVTVPAVLARQLKEINPNLNTDVLNNLEKRPL